MTGLRRGATACATSLVTFSASLQKPERLGHITVTTTTPAPPPEPITRSRTSTAKTVATAQRLVKSGKHCAEGSNAGNAVLGGFAYWHDSSRHKRIPLIKYMNKNTGSSGSTELIGWSGGYFVGTPEYYITWVSSSDAYGAPFWRELDGSKTPYLTLNLQVYASDYLGRTEIEDCFVKAFA